MEKTLVLWKKLWYYTENYIWNFDFQLNKTWWNSINYETLIYDGKTLAIYQNN